MSEKIYDFIAIGLGPFNLSLAAMSATVEDLEGLVLEQREAFNWHPGMMLESAHLQTPFMSDLVTMADPTHPLSFLNYKKEQGRLYAFYIREDFFLMRKEYNQYCRWAIEQLNSDRFKKSGIEFQQQVQHIEYDPEKEYYRIQTLNLANSETQYYASKKFILGTGPKPYFPKCCDPQDKRILHTGDYLYRKAELQKQKSITIVGGGQSAAEIYYDLLQEIDTQDYQLNWVTRSARFFPLEYSKLTLEMTSPEYVDYFYSLPQEKRDQLIASQKNLYKGINQSLINEIYDLLYVKQLSEAPDTRILSNAELLDCQSDGNRLSLAFHQSEQDKHYRLQTDCVVLATGYKYQEPAFLAGVASQIHRDHKGRMAVNRDYSIDANKRIFVQNVELHTHGFVTPDLGMACYRNSCIIRELLGYEHYPIEKRIAFQDFCVPDDLIEVDAEQ